MRWLALAVVVLAGCPKAATPRNGALPDQVNMNEHDVRASLIAELQDEVLASYEREETPELDTQMIAQQVGAARIGVGPGDVLVGAELVRPRLAPAVERPPIPSRWPLDVDPRTRAYARSKLLHIHLAAAGTAAWVSDEVSWRIELCGRISVIPLRMTALFARDGDRWVPVFEHLSFGRTPTPLRTEEPAAKVIDEAILSPDLQSKLSSVLTDGILKPTGRNPAVVANGREALLLGPDVADEWRALEVIKARHAARTITPMKARVGTVGRSLETATVAYWVGNFEADLPPRPGVPAGKVALRGTFVFEKRKDGWVVVQGHLSQPVVDEDLAGFVYGTALTSSKPLEVMCSDQTAPAQVTP